MSQSLPHHHILAAIQGEQWAITQDGLNQIIAIAQQGHGDLEAVAAKLGNRLPQTNTVQNRDGVAVVPVIGPIFRYANILSQVSGATSIDLLARDFSAALADPAISAIVLEIDSPGGMTAGVSEFAGMVRSAAPVKPVIAYVSNLGASAGYWIAAAAKEIVVADTAMLGSIGTVMRVSIAKDSGAVEIVSSQSPLKRPDPATAAGRAQMQKLVDASAQVFVEAVASYRGTTADKVLSGFGQGDLLMGRAAVAAGMADRLGSLESVIKQYSTGRQNPMNQNHQSFSHAGNTQAPTAQTVDQQIQSEWARSADLQREFTSFNTYAAFRKAEMAGQVKIHGGAVRSGAR